MKLTMISVRHRGITYTGFVYMKPGTTLTEATIERIVKHSMPVGTTYTPGG